MIKGFRSGNASIFFVCILISTFIWLVIELNTQKAHSISVPVNYLLDDEHVLLNELPKAISISTSGEVANLIAFQREIKSKPISFNISSQKAIDLKSQNNQIVNRLESHQLHLIQNHGNTIQIELDSVIQKSLPVKNQIIAFAEKPYSIIEESISPMEVIVMGPSSVLFYIDSIETSKTEIKGLISNYQDSIFLLKSLSNKLKLNNDKVLYKATVAVLKPFSFSLNLADFEASSFNYDSLAISFMAPSNYQFNPDHLQVNIQELGFNKDTITVTSNNIRISNLQTVAF